MLKIIPAIYKEGKVELLGTPPEESLARIFVIFEVSEEKRANKRKKTKARLSELEACGMWADRTDWPDHPTYRHLQQLTEEKKDDGSCSDG